MDKDRVAGSAKQVKGTIKELVGKAIGDTKARFSEVCRAADDERLAVRAAVGNGESTQLSRAIDTGEGDGTNGMRPCGRSDRLD